MFSRHSSLAAHTALSGVMLLRNLVDYDISEAKPVSALVSLVLPQCPPDLSLVEGMSHLGLTWVVEIG